MYEISQNTVNRLIAECGFSKDLAIVYVRANGRCEYCGADLLMSRQGYAIAEIDHLLPKSKYPEYSTNINNLVLSCRTCNGIKRNENILCSGELPDLVTDQGKRSELIQRSRNFISKKMGQYDETWRKATEILHEVWWRK